MTSLDPPVRDLIDLIPLDARRVLDLGCGSGAIGADYKRRNPAARVLGITASDTMAQVARDRLDGVFVADLEHDPWPDADELAGNDIDCMIYDGVLEFLRNPWEILRRHIAHLSAKGLVLLRLANAEHWMMTEEILRGTWDCDEADSGERRPMRMFTLAGACRALRKLGLASIDVVDDDAGAMTDIEGFADALSASLRELGIDKTSYLHRAKAARFICRARRPVEQQSLRLVSTMLNPIGGVSQVRVRDPMRSLAADPSLVTSVIGLSDMPPPHPDGPRVFVFHRPLLAGRQGLARLRSLIEAGWIIVCEFDDHPDYIPVLRRPDVFNFSAVHAIQTSTETLARVLREQNPEVCVFENAQAQLPEIRNYEKSDCLNLLFAGLNRERDWPPYLASLNAVAARAGARLHFRIVNDRGLYEALNTPHKTFTPLCDYETYQDLLAGSEISFMPLSDNVFNRCKSDLKFVEAGAHRVAALASTTVYGATVRDGVTGVLFRNSAELEQRLMTLVANPELGRAIGDAARSYVAGRRMLAYQIERRIGWYRSLWARREELNRSLVARVPDFDFS